MTSPRNQKSRAPIRNAIHARLTIGRHRQRVTRFDLPMRLAQKETPAPVQERALFEPKSGRMS